MSDRAWSGQSVDDAWTATLAEATGHRHDPATALAVLTERRPSMPSGPIRLLGLCGPGGVGKDTTIAALAGRIAVTPLVFDTTRAPRPDETPGAAYHFIRDADFRRREADAAYLMCRRMAGRGNYGLRKQVALRALRTPGLIVVKEAPRGLATIFRRIRSEAPDTRCAMICLLPPWPIEQHLQARLAARAGNGRVPVRAEREALRQVAEFRDYLAIARAGDLAARIVINRQVDATAAAICAAVTT